MGSNGEWEIIRYEENGGNAWIRRNPTPEEVEYDKQLKERVKQKVAKMAAEVTFEILPGLTVTIDTTKFNIENNLSIGGFSEGADIKVYVDVRLVDVISKEQTKAESLVILRTK